MLWVFRDGTPVWNLSDEPYAEDLFMWFNSVATRAEPTGESLIYVAM